ncbi:MAG: hypothetical protein RR232_00420 [Clostridia bacterium]
MAKKIAWKASKVLNPREFDPHHPHQKEIFSTNGEIDLFLYVKA